MYDRWEYKIPANTAEANAIKVQCGVSPGILKSLVVFFPPGCQGYARCRINIGERPIAPRSPSNFLAADGMAILLHYIREPIKYDMPVLNWFVWNEDDTYDHAIWMAAEWTSEEEPYDKSMVALLRDFIAIMKGLIGI